MKLAELRKILALCKKMGVKLYTSGDLSIQFEAKPKGRIPAPEKKATQKRTEMNPLDLLKALDSEPMPSDEDLLFASVKETQDETATNS